MKDQQYNDTLRVAVVGDFQIGKSSLVNCLLSESLAATGERFYPTTDSVAEYDFSPGVHLADTPGFNDERVDLSKYSEEAMNAADAVLFIKTDKTLGSRDVEILRKANGKPLIVLFNCDERTLGSRGSDPELRENGETCMTITSQLAREGLTPSILPIRGALVKAVNILWAQYGTGLMLSEEQTDAVIDFAQRKLGITTTDEALRGEMLQRSGIQCVKELLLNLPLELLKHSVAHPQREIDRIVDRFSNELKRRWTAA